MINSSNQGIERWILYDGFVQGSDYQIVVASENILPSNPPYSRVNMLPYPHITVDSKSPRGM